MTVSWFFLPYNWELGIIFLKNQKKRKDLNIICQNWHNEVISSLFFWPIFLDFQDFRQTFLSILTVFLYCFGNVVLTSIKGNNTRCKERNCEKTCHVKKDLKNKCKNTIVHPVSLQKHLLGQTFPWNIFDKFVPKYKNLCILFQIK